ncbi:MAG: arginine--tRNA ligase [Nitrospirota bacterium]
MKFNIDQEIFQQYPDLKIGAILIKGINNAKRVSGVESLLRGICAQRERQYKDADLHMESFVAQWDKAYGRFGINPKKNMPSITALLKRVVSGKEIPHINALVDIYNYYSLKFFLPIGGEDIDWLHGDLNLKYTKGGEPFRPIGSIDVQTASEGEIAYMDNGGITCRYWNHRECERTKFTNKTVNALLLVEDLSKMHMDEFGKLLEELQDGISKYIGGEITTNILTEEKPSLDLGVEGRMNADDSKVPQQEKAHFMAQAAAKQRPKPQEVKEQEPQKSQESVENQLAEKKKYSTSALSDESLLAEQIKKVLESAVKKAFGKLDKEVKIEYPASEDHGDYASNIALQITKDLGKPPQEIAQKIIDNIEKNELVEKVEIAGPGFINFYISEKTLNSELEKILKEKDKYGSGKENKKNIVIDYSQPNIAKPLGVHHLLSTIIGQSLYNIYKFLGYNCIGINYIGDWGTQFGKLTYAYKNWGDKSKIEKEPIAELLNLYVRFHDEAEKDPELEQKARDEFKKLEDGDEENTKLWEWFCKVSLEEVQRTYDFLGGIHFDHIQGESFFNDKMEVILEKGKREKVFEKGEQGALIVKFENDKYPPYLVQKSDGATLYSTRDLAAINYREQTWHPEKILYVVDVAQSLHFQQLYETAEKLKLTDAELTHVVFGRMQFKDEKMSTRKGNIVLLDEVLKESVEKAEKIVEGKNRDLSDKEKKEIAHKIGIGAAKYVVLSQNRTTNITFDWDKMLSLEGNSAPYLQYTYARAKSILRKSETIENQEEQQTTDEITAKTLSLQRHLAKFKEYILYTAQEYKPNILANYLYELAQKFNSFYNSVPVLRASEKEREERLKIVEATSQVLKNGLTLLGVELTEEM